jgi:lysophospholipase L1-like esterase
MSSIHLVGDAILDNFYWLSDREKDLKKEISNLGYNVHNHAVDHVKVSDILDGIVPHELYIKSRSYPYPTDKDGKIYPLKLILKHNKTNKSFANIYSGLNPICGTNSNHDNMVVISMGGNDIFSKFKNIILGVDYFFGSVVTSDFISNYEKIIETIKANCQKIVLVSIYLPYLGVGSSYGLYSPMAKPIMDKWHIFIHNIGRKYNIPVLDLSRTLNIGERTHYGTDDTRASNLTNICVAKCIAYIHSNYDGYHVYYCPDCDFSKITVE